ncbi:MAG: YfhO family protein, partial [Lachnospiraceae bacterium]
MFRRKEFPVILLTIISIVLILLSFGKNEIYGSTIDWVTQHSIFPEYFRNQFYETGKLIPEFAFHLGGGQNMFHFSYYGFLSPIILISYFLPFVPMVSY